jgi:hypothetical protein
MVLQDWNSQILQIPFVLSRHPDFGVSISIGCRLLDEILKVLRIGRSLHNLNLVNIGAVLLALIFHWLPEQKGIVLKLKIHRCHQFVGKDRRFVFLIRRFPVNCQVQYVGHHEGSLVDRSTHIDDVYSCLTGLQPTLLLLVFAEVFRCELTREV